MTGAPKLRLEDVGRQFGSQLTEAGKTSLSRFLYGNGPSLADRLTASAKSSETFYSKTLNKFCEALTHV